MNSTRTTLDISTTHAGAPRLGVDIGRVIILGDGPDTSFVGGTDEEARNTPPVPGALEQLADLTAQLEGRVWLVSKCGPRIQQRTRAWLGHHRFFERTGIARDHLHFCRDRKEKAPICAKLGIGLFVDDRVDVLVAMEGVVEGRFLFGASRSPVPGLVPVATWAEAGAALGTALSGRLRGPRRPA